MTPDPESVRGFRDAYNAAYGEDLSEIDAAIMFERLLSLYRKLVAHHRQTRSTPTEVPGDPGTRRYRYVVVYLVEGDRFLAFQDKRQAPELSGITVPTGPIYDRETAEEAALRVLDHQVGHATFKIVSRLGTVDYREGTGVHERHVLVAEAVPKLPKLWEVETTERWIEFFWIPIAEGRVLENELGALPPLLARQAA
jgi:hypothetical protein